MVDDSSEFRTSFHYIKPAEVPDEGYGGPVQPFSSVSVHVVRLLPPGPEDQQRPQGQEVCGDVAGQDGGEEGHTHHTWANQEQVPQEVDYRGRPSHLLRLRDECTHAVMVGQHGEGEAGKRADDFKDWGGGNNNVYNSKCTQISQKVLIFFSFSMRIFFLCLTCEGLQLRHLHDEIHHQDDLWSAFGERLEQTQHAEVMGHVLGDPLYEKVALFQSAD